jgi:hypothetical protein
MAALIALTLVSWVGSFAQSADGALDQIVSKPKPGAADHRGHDCCAHQKGFPTIAAIPVQPADMPCGDEQPCCVRPVPQNVPNLPTGNGQRPPAEQIRAFRVDASLAPDRIVAASENPRTPRDPSQLSTVLRI